MTDIHNLWDVFLRRKVFLVGHLAFQLGERPPIQCKPVDDLTATLLYLDLVSILDEALQDRIAAKHLEDGGQLHRRIEALAQARELLDPTSLHAIRKKRNRLAHDQDKAGVAELECAVSTVEAQLQTWGYVATRPNYVPFVDESSWRPNPNPGDLHHMRDFFCGVQVAETGEPVLEYRFEEYADDPASPMVKFKVAYLERLH